MAGFTCIKRGLAVTRFHMVLKVGLAVPSEFTCVKVGLTVARSTHAKVRLTVDGFTCV